MNLELNEGMTFPAMTKVLTEKLPDCKVELKKNGLLKFEYIEIAKSGWVGQWIRLYENKKRVKLINAIPSTLYRGLTGLLGYLFTAGAQKKLRTQVADALKAAFNTLEAA